MRHLSALLVLTLLAGPLEAQQSAEFKVIVNQSAPASTISMAKLSRLFLKKETRWSDGRKVLPVDQLQDSPIRQTFSLEVHNKQVDSVKSYWHQMIFSGRATAPPELRSDAEVLEYVRSNAGAIGYTSAVVAVGDGIRVLRLSD